MAYQTKTFNEGEILTHELEQYYDEKEVGN